MNKLIERLTVLILTIAAVIAVIHLSTTPNSTADAVQAVTVTNAHDIPTKGAHFSQSGNWTARPYPYSLIGDCLADRTTGDLYPEADPYCLTGETVAVVETDRKDTTANVPVVPVVVPDTRPLEPNQEFPYEPPIIVPTDEPDTTEPPVIVPDEPKQDKPKCNKGEGNGGENCNPGNHPENGNDDENQTSPREDNSHKPEKEDKSK